MLRKVLLVVVVAVLTAGFAQAQFKIGARAGFNLTTVTGKDVPDNTKLKPGFQIGIVGDYAFSEAFSIQPGLLFAQQGFKNEDTEAGVSIKQTYKLNYLQLPINAQYKFDLGGTKLFLQAGPYLGYGLGGKYKLKRGSVSLDGKIKFGDEPEIYNDEIDINNLPNIYFEKAFEFGIGAGVGLQFCNFQVGFGYNLGLTSLFKDETVQNGGLQLTLTYLFGKK
jgi:hypothetical protein